MANKIIIAVFMVCMCAWQAHAQVNCTTAGRFANPTDTTCKNYTLCVFNSATNAFLSYNYVCPSTSLFSPTLGQCTATYTCNVTTTTANTTTNTSVCTADGFIADPTSTNCSSYIQCVNINGTYSQTPFSCPSGTLYNPNTTICDTTYNCTTTAPFTCATAGRFANTADTTCQTYYYCVLLNNGTFAEYQYTCPSTSVFNPASRLCTASYTCTN